VPPPEAPQEPVRKARKRRPCAGWHKGISPRTIPHFKLAGFRWNVSSDAKPIQLSRFVRNDGSRRPVCARFSFAANDNSGQGGAANSVRRVQNEWLEEPRQLASGSKRFHDKGIWRFCPEKFSILPGDRSLPDERIAIPRPHACPAMASRAGAGRAGWNTTFPGGWSRASAGATGETPMLRFSYTFLVCCRPAGTLECWAKRDQAGWRRVAATANHAKARNLR